MALMDDNGGLPSGDCAVAPLRRAPLVNISIRLASGAGDNTKDSEQNICIYMGQGYIYIYIYIYIYMQLFTQGLS